MASLARKAARPIGEQNRRWIVDPLDGTTNFLHGVPHWSISIALESEGEIVAGVIHDPIKNEMFMTEKGQGSWLGRRRLRVSSRDNIGDALVAFGVTPKSPPQENLNLIGALLDQSIAIRRQASAALDPGLCRRGTAGSLLGTGHKPLGRSRWRAAGAGSWRLCRRPARDQEPRL